MNEPRGVEDGRDAQAGAALLDELAGVYRGEALGQLTRPLAAVRDEDRLGI